MLDELTDCIPLGCTVAYATNAAEAQRRKVNGEVYSIILYYATMCVVCACSCLVCTRIPNVDIYRKSFCFYCSYSCFPIPHSLYIICIYIYLLYIYLYIHKYMTCAYIYLYSCMHA